VDRGGVEADLIELGVVRIVAALDRLQQSCAVGDVAARVLVEERVQEGQSRTPDPRIAVDERHLAEHRGPVVGAHLLAHDVHARARPHLDRPAALEAHLEVADDVARERQRLGRADGSLGAAAVGCREDLLRRHVDHVPAAVHGLLERGAPGRARRQADGQIGAGAAEANAVEPAVVQQCPALDELGDVPPPRVDGVGLVEAGRRDHCVPEPLHVRLAEDRRRPALVRVGDDRPVEQPLVRRLHVALGELAHSRPADAGPVEVREQLRLGVADDVHLRAVLLGQVVDLREHPRRRPVERFLVGVLDPCPTDVLVRVIHVDVAGAVLVRAARDRPHQRGVLGQRRDPDQLARADVRPHLDRQARIAFQPFLRPHRPNPIALRW
jgi:hypothetical protein